MHDLAVRTLAAAVQAARTEISTHAGGSMQVASPPRVVDEHGPNDDGAAPAEAALADRLAMLSHAGTARLRPETEAADGSSACPATRR